MLPTKFQFIWESGFRGEDFLEINQSKTRMACGGHVCCHHLASVVRLFFTFESSPLKLLNQVN
jgi:hypothetical protein